MRSLANEYQSLTDMVNLQCMLFYMLLKYKDLVILRCENKTSQQTNLLDFINHKMIFIMKKAILTAGLFSLVVLTSFTTSETSVQNNSTDVVFSEIGGTGNGQSIGGNKKHDELAIGGTGNGQSIGGNKKHDELAIGGTGNGQSIGGNKKHDE